jgi:hypothetical protein
MDYNSWTASVIPSPVTTTANDNDDNSNTNPFPMFAEQKQPETILHVFSWRLGNAMQASL